MKRRIITPLPYFTRDKHVDLDESDVDSNLENQVRNTRQMVGHGLCTSYLGSANTNYTALFTTAHARLVLRTAITRSCVDMYI